MVYLKIFDLIELREDIKDKDSLKKVFVLLEHSKNKFKLNDQHYESFLDSVSDPKVLSCFYRYLFTLGQTVPGQINFIFDLEREIQKTDISLKQWLDALFVIDTWLKTKNLKASLVDIRGYISCLYEFEGRQGAYFDLSQYILLMLNEHGFDKAFSS